MGVMIEARREFKMASVTLPDPDPTMSPDMVKDEVYALNYPHLAFAGIEGPTVGDDGSTLVYSFVPPPAQTKG